MCSITLTRSARAALSPLSGPLTPQIWISHRRICATHLYNSNNTSNKRRCLHLSLLIFGKVKCITQRHLSCNPCDYFTSVSNFSNTLFHPALRMSLVQQSVPGWVCNCFPNQMEILTKCSFLLPSL